MDKLRKTNAFIGSITKDVNMDMTDDEINTMMNITVGQYVDALSGLPESIKKLSVEDLLDLSLNVEDCIDEILERLFGDDPSDEELEEFYNGFMKISKLFGA